MAIDRAFGVLGTVPLGTTGQGGRLHVNGMPDAARVG